MTIVLGDAGEADLDPVDTERVEELRDLQLLVRRQDDTDRLLAVAQRRVVQTDDFVAATCSEHGGVQRARPDLVAIDQAASPTQSTCGGAGCPCASSHETTGFRRMPIRSISASTTSPGFR